MLIQLADGVKHPLQLDAHLHRQVPVEIGAQGLMTQASPP
jgi:hypothetical protein